MNKRQVHANFSKNAASYDDHAAVQKRCAEKLIEMAGKEHSRILEIGCGTGVYTSLLRRKYPSAFITAIDISEDMIGAARRKMSDENVFFAADDAEDISIDGTFDLITSNASFQWFDDLGASFNLFSKLFDNKGLLCFSMYGPETFKELKVVLSERFGSGQRLNSSEFMPLSQVKKLAEKYFREVTMFEKYIKADFASLWDLLWDIKYSGTRGRGLDKKVFLGKNDIKEMEKIYIEKFGGITATHHVFFCKAEA